MNKLDIISSIAQKTGYSRPVVEEIVSLSIESMKQELLHKGSIILRGFGSFNVVNRKSHIGRNPKTGETVVVKPQDAVVFRMSDVFKEELNKGC